MRVFRLIFSCVVAGVVSSHAEDIYRAFKDTTGRVIEAQVVDYRKGVPQVLLKLSNGRKGRVAVDTLCEQDRAYLEAWLGARCILDPALLSIRIAEEESKWEGISGGRDNKTTSYSFRITNKNQRDLRDVRIEYCLYRQREHYIAASNHTLECNVFPAGEATTLKLGALHVSYRKKSDGFLNEVIGARLRLFMESEDGFVFVREETYPKGADLDKQPWVRGEFEREKEKKEATPPEDYPAVEQTEAEILALAEAYVQAYMNADQQALQDLLRPMYPGDTKLDSDIFFYTHHRLTDISIKEVDGRNVALQIRRNDKPGESAGWLMISPSGHIKYTPFLFLHPIEKTILPKIHVMLHKDEDTRQKAFRILQVNDIPTFDYKVNGNFKTQSQAVYRIIDWLEDKGREYDSTKPVVPMPGAFLNDELKALRRAIDYQVEKGI